MSQNFWPHAIAINMKKRVATRGQWSTFLRNFEHNVVQTDVIDNEKLEVMCRASKDCGYLKQDASVSKRQRYDTSRHSDL